MMLSCGCGGRGYCQDVPLGTFVAQDIEVDVVIPKLTITLPVEASTLQCVYRLERDPQHMGRDMSPTSMMHQNLEYILSAR